MKFEVKEIPRRTEDGGMIMVVEITASEQEYNAIDNYCSKYHPEQTVQRNILNTLTSGILDYIHRIQRKMAI